MRSKGYVGVDGCRGGWVAARLTDHMPPVIDVFEDLRSLWEAHGDAELILIDMPIGLPSEGVEERRCDVAARRLIGPRSASVFRVPCRQALRASSYEAACEINEAHTGKRLSKQIWNIMPSIRALDDLLREIPEARGVIRESHPEVIFRALAGEPMRRNKHHDEGFTDRLAVLEMLVPGAVALVDEITLNNPTRILDRADVVDALALAITARPGPGPLLSMPFEPPRDDEGLPMEIVYRPMDAEEIVHNLKALAQLTVPPELIDSTP